MGRYKQSAVNQVKVNYKKKVSIHALQKKSFGLLKHLRINIKIFVFDQTKNSSV